jgi:hypothetical protein
MMRRIFAVLLLAFVAGGVLLQLAPADPISDARNRNWNTNCQRLPNGC